MIRIVVHGPPPRKNAKSGTSIGINRKTGKPMRIPQKRTKDWRAKFYAALVDAGLGGLIFTGITRGTWRIRIDVYEKARRTLPCGEKVGHGDWDSCIEPVVDALKPVRKKQRGRMVVVAPGLFDDDDRIVEGSARKHYDKTNPRVEITITEDTP